MAQVQQPYPEIALANEYAEKGDFIQAFHHLEIAAAAGVPQGIIEREQVWIESLKRAKLRAREEHLVLVVAIPFVSYLLLSIAQPPSYGIAVWAGLAFLVVPILTGVALAKALAGLPRGAVFRWGFLLVAVAMALYTILNLSMVRNRIAVRVDPVPILAVGAAVTVAYALLAGLVAGLFSAAISKGGAA